MRTPEEDAEMERLLHVLDRTIVRLFDLGVNPYKRCTCVWSEPHARECALSNAYRIAGK